MSKKYLGYVSTVLKYHNISDKFIWEKIKILRDIKKIRNSENLTSEEAGKLGKHANNLINKNIIYKNQFKY